jgi:hypothetical protein
MKLRNNHGGCLRGSLLTTGAGGPPCTVISSKSISSLLSSLQLHHQEARGIIYDILRQGGAIQISSINKLCFNPTFRYINIEVGNLENIILKHMEASKQAERVANFGVATTVCTSACVEHGTGTSRPMQHSQSGYGRR